MRILATAAIFRCLFTGRSRSFFLGGFTSYLFLRSFLRSFLSGFFGRLFSGWRFCRGQPASSSFLGTNLSGRDRILAPDGEASSPGFNLLWSIFFWPVLDPAFKTSFEGLKSGFQVGWAKVKGVKLVWGDPFQCFGDLDPVDAMLKFLQRPLFCLTVVNQSDHMEIRGHFWGKATMSPSDEFSQKGGSERCHLQSSFLKDFPFQGCFQ